MKKTICYNFSILDKIIIEEFLENNDYRTFEKLSFNFKKFLERETCLKIPTSDIENVLIYWKTVTFIIVKLYKYSYLEFDLFYDVILPINSHKSSYMVSKIKKFLFRIMRTNSKNILYGDNKEKWGGIVGSVEVNRFDIALKIVRFVKNIRKYYPDITSSFTIKTYGFKLKDKDLKGLNNYVSNFKFKWQKKKRRHIRYKQKNFFYKNSIEKYKYDILKNRKQTIKSKYRNSWRHNFK